MSEAPAQHDPLPDLSPAAMRTVLGVPDPFYDPWETAPSIARMDTCGIFEVWILTPAGEMRKVPRSCDVWECPTCGPERLAHYREQVEHAAVIGVGIFGGCDSIYLTVSHAADRETLKAQRKRSEGDWTTLPEFAGIDYTFSRYPLTGDTITGDRQWHLAVDDARSALLALLTPGLILLGRKPTAKQMGRKPGAWHLHDIDRGSGLSVQLDSCPTRLEPEVWRIVGDLTADRYGFRWTKGEGVPGHMTDRGTRKQLAALWSQAVTEAKWEAAA